VYCKRAEKAFTSAAAAPDYRAELDVSIVDPAGGVKAFCTVWLDETNRLAVLEPIGTVMELQGRRLGKAARFRHRLSELAERGGSAAAVRDHDGHCRLKSRFPTLELEVWI
jgi:hypothetical protein